MSKKISNIAGIIFIIILLLIFVLSKVKRTSNTNEIYFYAIDSIYEYIKDVMPQVKTHEQQLRLLGDILSALSVDKLIYAKGRIWFLKE